MHILTKIMTTFSVAALLVALLWRPSVNYQLLLQFVVCVGAIAVVLQAGRAHKQLWAAAFVAIALLLNPAVPIPLSRNMSQWVNVVCLATFVVSLAALKTNPMLSISSITDRTPGSEAL